MKKIVLIAFASLGFNVIIAQSSLDRASGGYFNNNDPTPAPAGTHTISADSALVLQNKNKASHTNRVSKTKKNNANSKENPNAYNSDVPPKKEK